MMDLLTVVFEAVLIGTLAILPGFVWRVYLPDWVPHRAALSPLLGMCSWAWWIQLVYLFNGPAAIALISFLVLIAGVLLVSSDAVPAAVHEFYQHILPRYLIFFVFCLLATSLVVWPAAGPWSSDWLATYQQLEVIAGQQPLRAWLLARPPMFASLAIPYLEFAEPLAAFQLSLCAASAAALVCVHSYVQSMTAARVSTGLFLWLFCCSAFFLVNFTSFVPKFLQATLLLGAFLMMRDAGDRLAMRMGLSSLLLSFAIECHHSSIAYVVGLGLGWLWFGRSRPKQLVQGIVLASVVGMIAVGLPELRKVATYGLSEIAKYNPSKAMRSPEPVWFVVLMTLECKLVGYQFLVPPYIWLKDLSSGSPLPTFYYLNWFWFVALGVLSNTFVFVMLPFVFSVKRVAQYASYLHRHVPSVLIVGAVIAVVINCLLNPYYISSGNVHCGSTCLALALMVLAVAWIAEKPQYGSTSERLTLMLGCVPWLLWQCTQFVLVLSAGGIKRSGQVLDDNLDYDAMMLIDQQPWGHTLWPWLPLTLILVLSLLVWQRSQAERTSLRSSQPLAA